MDPLDAARDLIAGEYPVRHDSPADTIALAQAQALVAIAETLRGILDELSGIRTFGIAQAGR